MGRGHWPLFTTCLSASRKKSAHGDMQPKEPSEIAILNSHKVHIVRDDPSENLRKFKRRKLLVETKKKLSAWTILVALLGIVLMVVHTELMWYSKCEWFPYLFLVKCSISISTVILIILIIAFHFKEIQIFMNDNSLQDWRIAVNAKNFGWILLEVVVCAIHPFPYELQCVEGQGNNSEEQTLEFLSEADIFLSILMFLRVYLLPRTVLLYSRVLGDTSYRTIGSLNKIKFQYKFVMKVLMNTCPGKVLLILSISLWIVSSWVLSVCERKNNVPTGNMTSALWLIPITFLTIGYGDMVPNTVCGKLVCLSTGVMGVGCTALIVAVAAQKLEFTRAEKHVHTFMMDIRYMKQIKCAAANVLGEAWLLHRHTKKGDKAKTRQHQRNLFRAIHEFRHRRISHKNLKDQMNTMVDISKMQMIMYDMDLNVSSSHRELEKRIDQLDKKLDDISRLIITTIESSQLSH
ncbi:intermediate conductance calcium-activated potassium channel protein 4 [Xenopus laevis]|uniref:Intermediate conductance calcium-activated potassium channel protein 4 n=2 Tax=Xenopus laevis TaxID=8355 RepID=A0A8J1LDJ7_XENLA|nr:intermediate conductance calcium-activated potassium channel protein 4 [Xenopus laevis]